MSTRCPGFLIWRLTINVALSLTTTHQASGPTFWFGNRYLIVIDFWFNFSVVKEHILYNFNPLKLITSFMAQHMIYFVQCSIST